MTEMSDAGLHPDYIPWASKHPRWSSLSRFHGAIPAGFDDGLHGIETESLPLDLLMVNGDQLVGDGQKVSVLLEGVAERLGMELLRCSSRGMPADAAPPRFAIYLMSGGERVQIQWYADTPETSSLLIAGKPPAGSAHSQGTASE